MGGAADDIAAPLLNGNRYVSRYEWQMHEQWARDVVAELKVQSDQQAIRIDHLERRWDRYAGPMVVILTLMGAIATIASISSALVVMSR